MQVSKCIDLNSSSRAQNLIEFMFILPILIFMTLVVFEVALFWQEANAIYDLNNEINANLALISTDGMRLGTQCSAADEALAILERKDGGISLSDNTYTENILDGQEPFALYQYTTPNTVTDNTGVSKPQISMWVDCRNPFEEGFTSQIEFYHKTVIIKATIPRFDSRPAGVAQKDWVLEVIPDDIFIASPKLSTVRHY